MVQLTFWPDMIETAASRRQDRRLVGIVVGGRVVMRWAPIAPNSCRPRPRK